MKKKYAVIAIGYNRDKSLQRLLESLAEADYGDENITLIVSIDNSGVDTVVNCAKEFEWKFGEKRVITYKQRQGLRKHILNCGEFLNEFDAVAVFEDDIVVAKGFFKFMKIAVETYYDDDQVAGISLYKHLWNVNVNMPFEPATSRFDAFFMQFAQSWGQIWLKKQWFEFITWYKNNCKEFFYDDKLPQFVAGWSNSSWLKYHIKYCVDNDKYFVYPYVGLATCFSDVGEHTGQKLSYLQIPLLEGVKEQYHLPQLVDKDVVKYDVFFERQFNEGECRGIAFKDICLDLYGCKFLYEDKRYIISSQSLPYHRIGSFGLEYRPHEVNLLKDYDGNDFWFYDTEISELNNKKNNGIDAFLFYFRLFRRDKMFFKCILWHAWLKLKRKVRSIVKAR